MTRLLALAVAAILLTSCIDDSEEGGVGLVDGVPVVVYTPCPWTGAASIELIRSHDEDWWDEDDEVIWRVNATRAGALPFVSPIGTAPPTFSTDVELAQPLPEEEEFVLWVHNRGGGGPAIFFRVSSLQSGRILTDTGDLLSRASFLERITDACSGGHVAQGSKHVLASLGNA